MKKEARKANEREVTVKKEARKANDERDAEQRSYR